MYTREIPMAQCWRRLCLPLINKMFQTFARTRYVLGGLRPIEIVLHYDLVHMLLELLNPQTQHMIFVLPEPGFGTR